jgi:acylphosphatase
MTETGAIIRRVVVEGYVQGVGYREFTRREAQRLGVSGWVRNRSDGAVEALICGPPAAVEALVAGMRSGPHSAVVNKVGVMEHEDIRDVESDAFVIWPTA